MMLFLYGILFIACIHYVVASSGQFHPIQSKIINQINQIRRISSPESSNMMEMKWSNELAQSAEEYAKTCPFVYSNLPNVGESIYFQESAIVVNQDYNPNSFFQQWVQDKIANPTIRGSQIGIGEYSLYSQLVWAKSNKIGCGFRNNCSGWKTVVVCHFQEKGNVPGKSWYSVGPKCSNCPSGTTCKNGLCSSSTNPVPPSPTAKPPTPPPTTTKPPTNPPAGKDTEYNGQFRSMQKKIVNIFNAYRRSTSPSAANMLELQWDSRLAQSAESAARQCVLQSSNTQDVGKTVLGMSYNIRVNSVYDPRQFIDFWARDKPSVSHSNGDNVVKGDYNNYSQMIWAKTGKVGCAYATHCSGKSKSIIVCHWYKPGNYLGQPWYISGTPCSRCPTARHTCNNGLCVGPAGGDDDTKLRSGQFQDHQQKIVDIHNHYRRSTVPTAADMREVSWNNELAEEAEKHLKQCKFEYAKDKYYGQVLYAQSNSISVDFNYDVSGFINYWAQGSSYNQIIWAKTQHIGCAYATNCPGKYKTLIKCNYYQPGGYTGKNPYIPGTQCSKCGVGFICHNGLCVENI